MLHVFLEIRHHCLDCIVELASHHHQEEGSEDCWRQFSKARRIMKKAARARENPSLHCKEGLKEELMTPPRSYAVPTNVTSSEIEKSDRWLSDGKERIALSMGENS